MCVLIIYLMLVFHPVDLEMWFQKCSQKTPRCWDDYLNVIKYVIVGMVL